MSFWCVTPWPRHKKLFGFALTYISSALQLGLSCVSVITCTFLLVFLSIRILLLLPFVVMKINSKFPALFFAFWELPSVSWFDLRRMLSVLVLLGFSYFSDAVFCKFFVGYFYILNFVDDLLLSPVLFFCQGRLALFKVGYDSCFLRPNCEIRSMSYWTRSPPFYWIFVLIFPLLLRNHSRILQ